MLSINSSPDNFKPSCLPSYYWDSSEVITDEEETQGVVPLAVCCCNGDHLTSPWSVRSDQWGRYPCMPRQKGIMESLWRSRINPEPGMNGALSAF
jgi:hypothetical protein